MFVFESYQREVSRVLRRRERMKLTTEGAIDHAKGNLAPSVG